MPAVRCAGCDRTTNTAVSTVDDIMRWGKVADRCAMAVLEDGTAVKGCAYDTFPRYQRNAVDQYILEQPWRQKPGRSTT
jgi:hypothetical protein